MAVGDIHSKARGSGARYNDGKTPLELIPLGLIAVQLRRATGESPMIACLAALGRFQTTGDKIHVMEAIEAIGASWDECAAVFDYGRRKYDEWNWAKGMSWSIPLACAARHIVYGLMAGKLQDPESRLTHRGHILCNLVMLYTFVDTYAEGNDLPVGLLA